MKRRRIILEFIDDDEIDIFDKFIKISYPVALIKDVLCKKIKFEVLELILDDKKIS